MKIIFFFLFWKLRLDIHGRDEREACHQSKMSVAYYTTEVEIWALLYTYWLLVTTACRISTRNESFISSDIYFINVSKICYSRKGIKNSYNAGGVEITMLKNTVRAHQRTLGSAELVKPEIYMTMIDRSCKLCIRSYK